MFTYRPFYLSMLTAILVIIACTPQVAPTPIASLAASTPTMEAVPTTPAPPVPTSSTNQTPDQKFEVNGHALYLKCLGMGSPTIVLEPGEGGTVMELAGIQTRLAERTTTCAYDRANNGQSDQVPTPRHAKDVVEDLHALLAAADVPAPYLLVGQSAGGMLVQLYARTYPDQVIGVVAINPVPPAQAWLPEVSKVFTEEELAGEEAYYRGENGESLDYLTSSEQLAAAAAPPDVPFEMLLSTSVQCEGDEICLKTYAIYEEIMEEVTAAWPLGNNTKVEALHNLLIDHPEAVVIALDHVIALP